MPIRQCKKCNEIYRTGLKHSKVCQDCKTKANWRIKKCLKL